LLIGLLGSAAALVLASWGLDLLLALMPDLPRQHEIQLDWSVMLFTIALGAGTAVLSGLLPALEASRADVAPALHAEGTRTGARGPGRAMSALVVLEMVAGLVLTVGAGLMVTTLQRLQAVDPGYRADGLVRVGLPLPTNRYGTEDQQSQFYQRVLEKLHANAVTREAAVAFPAPLSGGASGGANVEGRPSVTERERPMLSITWVSPGYFKVMGIPLERGRDFDGHDVKGAAQAAVISQATASRLWPGEDPIGRRFNFGDDTDTNWFSVVGVVGDVRQASLSSAPAPMVYIPLSQNAVPLMSLLVRTDAGGGAVASAVKAAVRQVDPDLAVGEAADFSRTLDRSLNGQKLRATTLSSFAGAALLLAALGVYGLLSYTVARRRREIGIRLALGATPAHVFRSVVVEGMKLAAIGIGLGIPASLALTRLVASQLFGVQAGDPFTLAAVSVLLALVALVACCLPARRVLRIDPVLALRAE
jgi:predicted permease